MTGTVVAKSRRLLGAVLVLASGLVVTGCGGPTNNNVSGKVTYKDKDGQLHIVKGGEVVFYGDKKWRGASDIGEDGSYLVSKAPPGNVKITVDTKRFKPSAAPKESLRPKAPPDLNRPPGSFHDRQGNASAERYVEIPDKYAKKESSGLTYEVQPGKNQHDIELK